MSLSANDPPDRVTARMSRVDGCPECVTNTEPPRRVDATDDPREFIASYCCTDCGHGWFTSWRDA